jgi:hypothetical protein
VRRPFVSPPLDISSPDINAEQRKNVGSIAAAIRESAVRHVVLLSTWGAEVPERIGGVIACHWFERALDEIEDLNAVYPRPVWLMENFLSNIGLIKTAGINGLAITDAVGPTRTIRSTRTCWRSCGLYQAVAPPSTG